MHTLRTEESPVFILGICTHLEISLHLVEFLDRLVSFWRIAIK